MFFFFFKQKTAYEMRISDWSSDVCSSDLVVVLATRAHAFLRGGGTAVGALLVAGEDVLELHHARVGEQQRRIVARHQRRGRHGLVARSEEHTSELQSLMRISYAVFCLKKKNNITIQRHNCI